MPADPPAARLAGLDLLPLAPFPAALSLALAEELSRRIGLPVRLAGDELLGDGGQPAPAVLVAGRDQADADALLARLEVLPRRAGRLLVGATLQDIGNPVFTHFFGRARQGGHAALVSLARLRPEAQGLPPDAGLLLRRACCEVLHEAGHLCGLPHCADSACVMRFAPTVEAIDVRGQGFCAACAARLPAGLASGLP
jgi:archaemetzincin